MKKLMSLLLVLAMALSLSTAAFAAGENTNAIANGGKAYLTKVYTVTNVKSAADTVYPAETLQFAVKTESAPVALDGAPKISIADVTTDTSDGKTPIEIQLPTYETVGDYVYVVTETPTVKGQGVTYQTFKIKVTVVNGPSGLQAYVFLLTKGGAEGQEDVKGGSAGTDPEGTNPELKNAISLGNLSVQKKVTGNMADKNQKFDIDVVLTAANTVTTPITFTNFAAAENEMGGDLTEGVLAAGWTGEKTITLQLASTDNVVTIPNLPQGVTYKIAEAAKHTTGDANDPAEGYTVSYENQTGTVGSATTVAAVVTNDKAAVIPTGVDLDNAPYALLLALAVVGMGAVVLKKRGAREE